MDCSHGCFKKKLSLVSLRRYLLARFNDSGDDSYQLPNRAIPQDIIDDLVNAHIPPMYPDYQCEHIFILPAPPPEYRVDIRRLVESSLHFWSR